MCLTTTPINLGWISPLSVVTGATAGVGTGASTTTSATALIGASATVFTGAGAGLPPCIL